jgi:hypothetical protein
LAAEVQAVSIAQAVAAQAVIVVLSLASHLVAAQQQSQPWTSLVFQVGL